MQVAWGRKKGFPYSHKGLPHENIRSLGFNIGLIPWKTDGDFPRPIGGRHPRVKVPPIYQYEADIC